MFYLESTSNYLVANPVLYFEAGLRTQLRLYLPFLDYTIKFYHEGFRYNPLDLTLLWSLDNTKQYCYATQWNTRGLRTTVKTTLDIDECQFGLIGLFVDQFYQCRRRKYEPHNPFFQMNSHQLAT